MVLKTLNFNDVNSKVMVVGRMALHITPGMTDKEFLEKEIKKWFKSQARFDQIKGEAYYDGKHEILHRKRYVLDDNGNKKVEENLPNNKIIDNQFAEAVDKKANYLCGKPFVIDTENKVLGAALNKMCNEKIYALIRIVAEKSLTGGKSWVFPYYNDSGKLCFELFPAHEVLPFWADDLHTELDCAAHIYPVMVYDNQGKETIVFKVEILHGGGIDRFEWDENKEKLKVDDDVPSGAYLKIRDPETGEEIKYNWERIPLICFKYNHREIPLIKRVKCLQDALNLLLSDFVNNMSEDIHSTILVIHNYDGEDLSKFRSNLATYGAIKVKSVDGVKGGVDTLRIDVNSENYKIIVTLLKDAIIENARSYNAKDDRMNGNPNQMNIRSMYSDIDLDANGMETLFKSAMQELLWFIKVDIANKTKNKSILDEDVTIIFDRDIIVNETEVIDNFVNMGGRISNETLIKNHPWISDPEDEIQRLKKEEEAEQAKADPYQNAYVSSAKQRKDDKGGDVDE